MKKIVFGITSLSLGGAERVLVDICNSLKDKYDITIFTLYGEGEFETQLDKKVKIVNMYNTKRDELNKNTKLMLSAKLMNNSLRKKIYDKYFKDKYDVEVAFLEGPITWIMSEESNAKKIAWVHNDIEDVFGTGKKAEAKQKINKECYSKYDELVFVSKDNENKFKKYFADNKVSKRVIYNYLDTSLVKEKADKESAPEIKDDLTSFVQVSRLVDQKAVSRLIDVHKKLIDDKLNHRIYIVGNGPLEDELRTKIKSLNLEDTFILLGGKKNPYPYIKASDYFMLTSYYEGYPMVLLEARALNKYILLTDSAAREALKEYDDSKIVENSEEGIYEGIKYILENKPKVSKNNKDTNKDILKEITNLIEGE